MAPNVPEVNSESIYRVYWLYWRLLAVDLKWHPVFRLPLDILINFFVTLWYPILLLIELVSQTSMVILFKNLPITTACIFCSFKIICFRWKLPQIKKIQKLLEELDKKAISEEECQYFETKIRRGANVVLKTFLVFYSSTIISSTGLILLGNERELLYPAWFPYDVQASAFNYWLSFLYQSIGGCFIVVQNLINDTYVPMTLCVLSGHVKMLAIRMNKMDSTETLIAGIEDHRKLIEIIGLLRQTLSLPQLGQFISSGINLSTVLLYIVFFANNILDIVIYVVHFLAIALELFPACYYGSVLTMEFYELTYSIFSSDWIGKNREYCRSLLILMQLTLREVTIKAGGMVIIGMNAFFTNMRMAYSLFTLAMTFK
ncbi:odorant receptor 33b [Drosophila willistoni]|uniref:odorant receptor 33b n=1 Tax=Drosophila willistoni TaxID=7260 RepID=UPI000C26D9B0|nr:odorant receptor 33b [Drosophila willistoni]